MASNENGEKDSNLGKICSGRSIIAVLFVAVVIVVVVVVVVVELVGEEDVVVLVLASCHQYPMASNDKCRTRSISLI